ncbi:prephenate dehydrogenase/arogenate dehydrogenase family protein [Rhodococcus olei]|uniref:prephenate dehydrogenase/arogenate dehydrogenase family protein n=1 Tax=Rhodococcus olei TaxID=2161675 RepID=UPI003CD05BF9
MSTAAATTPRSVVVAGGEGAVGSMLADLWAGADASVLRPDVAAGPGCDIRSPGTRLRADIGSADVVVLAVPEEVALTAVGAVGPLLRPGAVLVETLSVKSRFAAAVAASELAAEVVGVNPMFAPSLGLPGRAVAVVVHRGGPAVDRIVADLTGWGARVQVTTADRHDRWCAAMQALTHAAVLSFGLALADLDVDAAETESLAPPPHTVLSALLARITGGSPEVYRDVQVANPYAAPAREALARAMARLADVCGTGTEAEFAALLADAAAPLGDRWSGYAVRCAELFEGLDR